MKAAAVTLAVALLGLAAAAGTYAGQAAGPAAPPQAPPPTVFEPCCGMPGRGTHGPWWVTCNERDPAPAAGYAGWGWVFQWDSNQTGMPASQCRTVWAGPFATQAAAEAWRAGNCLVPKPVQFPPLPYPPG